MGSSRIFSQQMRRFAAAGALLFATLVPALVPALVSAATITVRSVEMSTSAKGAQEVSYTVKFTAATANTGAFVVDFCDSPVIGTACTAPTGLDVTGVGTTDNDTVSDVTSSRVKVLLNTAAGAGQQVTVELTGITNPEETDPFYARIVTYADDTNASKYTPTDVDGTDGTYFDEGTVALATTENIGVTGSVLESMIFCASGPNGGGTSPITSGCTGTLTPPSVALGDEDGVLGTELSEGTIYSQISTNAASGAVVNLKSNTTGCGGLERAGATDECDITPVTTAGTIDEGDAKFGLKLANINNGSGTINPVADYSTTNYFMHYDEQEEVGVTSTYGDPIYNTNSKPISDGSVDLTFGANVSNDTPAGTYSATLSLIATGKF